MYHIIHTYCPTRFLSDFSSKYGCLFGSIILFKSNIFSIPYFCIYLKNKSIEKFYTTIETENTLTNKINEKSHIGTLSDIYKLLWFLNWHRLTLIWSIVHVWIFIIDLTSDFIFYKKIIKKLIKPLRFAAVFQRLFRNLIQSCFDSYTSRSRSYTPRSYLRLMSGI